LDFVTEKLRTGRKVQETTLSEMRAQKEKGVDLVAHVRYPDKNRIYCNVPQRPHIGGRKFIVIDNGQTT
jgi:hypothetical protein